MIKEYLLKYKGLTEAIIVNIKNDLDAETLMQKRGEILVKLLEDTSFNKQEIKNTYIRLSLESLDKILKEEINNARERNKEAIKEMKLRKNANSAYVKNINSINIFNKKI
ncbi:hypothetical protein SDC9_60152 [bioreactor metagenome]|uniref:Flagellar protein FliT n=1 Tax=bioreactor metagenome TaxID=1076179 RepID=A0A644XHY1_9ZZZZ